MLLVDATVKDLPEVEALLEVKFEEPLRIFSANGSLMAEFGVQRRRAVAFAEIPPQLINAFIAIEDSRFFEHAGIDPVGLARAALSVVRTGAPTQGGSTITMQVARNFFLTRDKTVERKLAEIMLALKMETALSKEQIMELYLNKIFFGHRAYGISAAAEFYYSKGLDELTLAEMAMLAGLPQAPSVTNPVSNPVRAKERRDHILDRMLLLGFIDEAAHAAAVAEPVEVMAYVPPVELRAGYVSEMVRQEMVERYGEEGAYSLGLRVYTTIDDDLQRSADTALRNGLQAYNRRHGYHGPEAQIEHVAAMTREALDAALAERPVVPGLPVGVVTQAGANSAEVYLGDGRTHTLTPAQVRWARRFRTENWRGPEPRRVTDAVAVGDVIRLRQTDKGDWLLAQVPVVSGALVALSPADGAIRALSGGYSFEWSKFNRVTDARRQPGSAFKPFVFAAALAKGYTPASLVRDEAFQQASGRGRWRPRNADGRFMGPIRIRVALARSRNLAIINLANRMGVDFIRDYVQNFGFALDSMPPDLPMVLGSGSTTPLELARGYALFANGGYLVEPYVITRIEDVAGNRLHEALPPRACTECWLTKPSDSARILAEGEAERPLARQTVDPRIAWSMDSMLRDVITEGTGTRARSLRRADLAGKTGTTNDARDSWFAGYQPELVTIAWMGRDDNQPLGRGEWGGTAALGVWTEFMGDALKGLPVAEIKRPDRMAAVRISLSTGKTTTATSGSRIEYIAEEFKLMTLGPDPVEVAQPRVAAPQRRAAAPRPPPPRRTAPRVLDELF
ncbi:MAG: PBP1A family penicillin-binding protein [Chromatiaceae bacterium]|nr:MAG: PBP1A family penicillin-binding protein [Chromatiaceae bacterium]